jgi:hypothetical protein
VVSFVGVGQSSTTSAANTSLSRDVNFADGTSGSGCKTCIGAVKGMERVLAVRGVSGLPETGQTTCYDDDGPNGAAPTDCGTGLCFGQDGFYATGCLNGCFVDNTDGTVTDTCTGLMWQKDTGNVNGDQNITNEDFPAGDRATWCDALAYCEGLSLGGLNDWRLPKIRELHSIADFTRNNPTIDPVFGVPLLPVVPPPLSYWSSTSHPNALGEAQDFNFTNGHIGKGIKAGLNFNLVRAVRG